MNAALTQDMGGVQQPIAYFCADKLEQGMPLCYQGLASVAYAYVSGIEWRRMQVWLKKFLKKVF